MCMLIHHPPNAARFTRAEFDDIYSKNKAGFGIIWRWPTTNKVSYEKGLWSPDRIWSTYDALYDHGAREFVLHWRQRTSGPVDLTNTHPFETIRGILVAHNGVLQHRSTKNESDTRCFIKDVLAPALRASRPSDRQFIRWLEDRIGSGNRIILWPRNQGPVIAGKSLGLTHKGRWYSNTYAWSAPTTQKWTNYRHWTTA